MSVSSGGVLMVLPRNGSVESGKSRYEGVRYRERESGGKSPLDPGRSTPTTKIQDRRRAVNFNPCFSSVTTPNN